MAKRIGSAFREYSGKAIEPIVRGAITRLLPARRFGDAAKVGGFWLRGGSVEVDLVGVPEGARRVSFVGSIKWRDRSPFGGRDLAALVASARSVPGSDDATRFVGVSRAGFSRAELDVALGPDELIAAWRRARRE